MSYFRAQRFNVLPPVVKNLLIINGLFFIATIVFPNLIEYLGAYYWKSNNFGTYQIISHMFMHGSFNHILFNMFAVWMFGSQLENVWGSKRFLNFYLLTGLGAAILYFLVIHIQVLSLLPLFTNTSEINEIINLKQVWTNSNTYRIPLEKISNLNTYEQEKIHAALKLWKLHNTPVVGASGALYGLLAAFGMLFPNSKLFIFPIPFPIPAKYFVIGLGAIAFISGYMDIEGDNTAHFAHLGGMVFGFLIIKYWQWKRK